MIVPLPLASLVAAWTYVGMAGDPASPAPVAPVVHRLADSRGVIWESDSPDRLNAWVGAVNRVYANPPVPAYRPSTSCAGGACGSGRSR